MKSSHLLAKLIEHLGNRQHDEARKLAATLSTMPLNEQETQLFKKLSLKLELGATNLLNTHAPCILKRGTSFVSACMNRNANLLKSLKSWLALEVDEIIIVDWSSVTPVKETLKQAEINDSRIRIVRVDHEKNWVLSYAFNVGFKHVQYDKVYKLDADIVTASTFLSDNQFSKTELVRGYWKTALDANRRDQMYVNGSFGCYTRHLREVNFYNEIIQTYGWDDSDLYQRLTETCGLTTKFLALSSVSHLSQTEQQRTAEQHINPNWLLDRVRPTLYSNQRNRLLSQIATTAEPAVAQNYAIVSSLSNVVELKRVTPSYQASDWVNQIVNRATALHFLQVHFPELCERSTDRGEALAEWANYCFTNHISFTLGLSLASEPDLESSQTIDCYQRHKGSFADHLKHTKASTAVVQAPHTAILHRNNVLVLALSKDAIVLLNQTRESLKALPVQPLTNFSAEELASATNSEPRIYIHAQHGLGNRLRAIASAASIAAAEKRKLTIIWEPDLHCDCTFDVLFNYDGEVLQQSPSAFDRPVKRFSYMPNELDSVKDALIEADISEDIVVKSAFTLNHPAVNYEQDNAFLRSLVPSNFVQSLVNSVDISDCIGVHIRMEGASNTKLQAYDEAEHWRPEDHQAIQSWRDKSHYSLFIEQIDNILADQPELGVFLATDLPETYKAMKAKYPNIKVLERAHFDRSGEQLCYALADLLLLAKCDMFLGSTWSSFSEMAKRLSSGFTICRMSGEF